MPNDIKKSSQRRRFKVPSEFGQARQPRSRKNRPCDACRKRKTACVITSTPPCLFCKGRGIKCRSSASDSVASGSAPSASSFASASAPQDAAQDGPSSNSESPRITSNNISLSTRSDPIEVIPAPYLQTLEDHENRTAHSMGPAAEQDTHFLASFRSDVLSGPNQIDAEFIQVYKGGGYPWDPPVHFCLLQDEFTAHDNMAREEASRAIEELVEPHGPTLVRLYFRHIHPVLLVLSKVSFLRQYTDDKSKLPASLRGAVYALASVFWKSEPSLQGSLHFQQHELADLATGSLQREFDSPKLAKLQASLLLLHMTPNRTDSIAHPRTWTSTAQAVAAAQMTGLHQDAEKWYIPAWEKRLRRKLWWATYVTDVWSALCHGNPPHIYPTSFNTSSIAMEDLRSDESVPEDLKSLVYPCNVGFDVASGARFLELVKVSQTLREVIDCSFQVTRLSPPYSQKLEMENRGRLVLLQGELHNWSTLLPQCLSIPHPGKAPDISNNAPLHLAYYAHLALLYRALMNPATKVSKAMPSSNLRLWFGTALSDFASFTMFMSELTSGDLQGFWGCHARSQFILCGNFITYLFVLATEPGDVTSAFNLLESFHDTLQRLNRHIDSISELLLLPVTLRIDSFFTQAADRLRGGPAAISTAPATSTSASAPVSLTDTT
ncbi:fungal-specific transcription factor domain-containing protein [Colletotrichum acutatum]|uniref:Fungal-specific transcription factor domain-containing protein n=1 Tax=Glomerella acutata TaxID=27357 RepID=A0AAD8UAC3_GLOAC|nr:fungal-specific transcription factor domain-containing protein [Colletotrichum acutatum]KAK1716053.1 fungal-specific transcription factor domain-containing protein [Colletotrichum acutatum]